MGCDPSCSVRNQPSWEGSVDVPEVESSIRGYSTTQKCLSKILELLKKSTSTLTDPPPSRGLLEQRCGFETQAAPGQPLSVFLESKAEEDHHGQKKIQHWVVKQEMPNADGLNLKLCLPLMDQADDQLWPESTFFMDSRGKRQNTHDVFRKIVTEGISDNNNGSRKHRELVHVYESVPTKHINGSNRDSKDCFQTIVAETISNKGNNGSTETNSRSRSLDGSIGGGFSDEDQIVKHCAEAQIGSNCRKLLTGCTSDHDISEGKSSSDALRVLENGKKMEQIERTKNSVHKIDDLNYPACNVEAEEILADKEEIQMPISSEAEKQVPDECNGGVQKMKIGHGSLELLIDAIRVTSGSWSEEEGGNSPKTEKKRGKKPISSSCRTDPVSHVPHGEEEEEEEQEESNAEEMKKTESSVFDWYADFEDTGPLVRSKRGRNQVLPSRFRDSVLEPWKRVSRPRFKYTS